MVPFGRLLTALGDIPDPRRAQGKRYALPHLLLFSVLAVLAGASSYQGIITFIGIHRERLNHVFGARFRRPPALNTLRNLLIALDPATLKPPFAATRVTCTGKGLRRACARWPWTAKRFGAASTTCVTRPLRTC